MGWDEIIKHNRDALVRIVAMLFAMAGTARNGVVEMLPRRARCKIVRTLRAAEAATRRLVVIQASTMSVEDHQRRAPPGKAIPKAAKHSDRLPSFPLYDRRKRFGSRRNRSKCRPCITVIGYSERVTPALKPEPTPDDPLDARQVCRRLEALARALEDLPAQAKRLMRIQAQRKHAPPGPRRVPPLRPGWPPGYRQRQTDPVDGVLSDCHFFALRALNPPRRIRPVNMAQPAPR